MNSSKREGENKITSGCETGQLAEEKIPVRGGRVPGKEMQSEGEGCAGGGIKAASGGPIHM